MAAGFTLDECIQSGLLELIERDALMINFMQRLNPPEINLESLNLCWKVFVENELNLEDLEKKYPDLFETKQSGYNKNPEADITSSIQALKTNTASTK